jgi:hypothetical protein
MLKPNSVFGGYILKFIFAFAKGEHLDKQNTCKSKCLSKFLLLFQICDVAQIMIIHKDILPNLVIFKL